LRFWDSSALVPLLVEEDATPEVERLFEADPVLVVWWGTTVECVSAVSRRERESELDAEQAETALARLDALAVGWSEVDPSEGLRLTARRLLRAYPLRGGDALQLAAAIAVAEGVTRGTELLTLDARLGDAARREGFTLTV
jgi:predicted nucleic acid-binding protein